MIQIFYLIFIDAPKEDLLSDRGRRQWGGGGGGACTTVRLDTELCTGRPTGLTTRLALRCWKVMNVMFGSYIYIYMKKVNVSTVPWGGEKYTMRLILAAAQHLCDQLQWWKTSSVTAHLLTSSHQKLLYVSIAWTHSWIHTDVTANCVMSQQRWLESRRLWSHWAFSSPRSCLLNVTLNGCYVKELHSVELEITYLR